MPIVIAILAVIALLVLGGAVLGTVANLLWFLLVGLAVGAVARLLIPGHQNISWLMTALCGAAGSLLGGILADRVFDFGTMGSLIVSVIVAVLLVMLAAGSRFGGNHDTRASV